ncbi:MAG: flagellar motor switch protein FliN [Phycisphaerales bacterium]
MPDDDTTPQDQTPETTPPEDAGQDAAPEASTPQAGKDAAEEALTEAQAVVRDTQAQVDKAVTGEARAFTPPEFTPGAPGAKASPIELLSDVNLNVKIELGRTRLLVEDVLRLGEGAVVELDKLAGDPVDIYVNDRHVARGEVLVLNDNFCVRVSEILEGLADATRTAAKD